MPSTRAARENWVSAFRVGLLGIDAEDAVFVAVQRRGYAMCQNVVVQHPHVAQRGLGGHEAQLRQLAGGIIDEHQQRAALAAPFKPVVGAAVDLDHLAKPSATLAHGVRAHRAAAPGFPITGPHHQLAGALDGQPDVVQFGELLVGQRRAEVAVMCADQLDGLGTDGSSSRRFEALPRFLLAKPLKPVAK